MLCDQLLTVTPASCWVASDSHCGADRTASAALAVSQEEVYVDVASQPNSETPDVC